MDHKQTGFTLIEIAIVLVIIGLLLGGLLASGTVTDANEARFLMERLKALESDEISTESSRP